MLGGVASPRACLDNQSRRHRHRQPVLAELRRACSGRLCPCGTRADGASDFIEDIWVSHRPDRHDGWAVGCLNRIAQDQVRGLAQAINQGRIVLGGGARQAFRQEGCNLRLSGGRRCRREGFAGGCHGSGQIACGFGGGGPAPGGLKIPSEAGDGEEAIDGARRLGEYGRH